MERTQSETCDVCGLIPLTPTPRRPTRIVAESPAMQNLLRRTAKFARSDAPVVVLGETGTGKEIIARTLHANGTRMDRPFVAVNVAALPADLLESELFGHAKGAFTGAATARRGLFEEADGGTLFLDEIGEMPLGLQAKLLRALQDGQIRRVGESGTFAVDVRIVCATHRDLAARVREGAFREDLYFRLKVLTLVVPPLRERTEDILPLATQLVAGEHAAHTFTPAAQARLLAHRWPGNVRELENAVRHGAALAAGAVIDAGDLPDELSVSAAAPAPVAGGLRTMAEVERDHILHVLDACGGSQTDAAQILGIGRNTLWRKVRSYA